MPLTGHFSNRQFGGKLDDLLAVIEHSRDNDLGNELDSGVRLCRCACGQAATGSRKFVNKDRYNGWLGRLRYFGRNAMTPPRTATPTNLLRDEIAEIDQPKPRER